MYFLVGGTGGSKLILFPILKNKFSKFRNLQNFQNFISGKPKRSFLLPPLPPD